MMNEIVPSWPVVWLALSMAAVTYPLRLGGLLLGERLPKRGRWAHVMNGLPAIIVVSLVGPGLWHAGPAGWIAGAATVGLSFLVRGLLVPMIGGVAVVALARAFLF